VIDSHFGSHEERVGDADDAFAHDHDAGAEQAPNGQRARDMENVAERRFREMLEFDARIFQQKGLRLLTPEARVLFYLSGAGPVSVTEAMKVAGTSYRAFYTVLARLKDAGLVSTKKDAQDQRIRKLSVDASLSTAPLHP
jgi:DNA-binding transcriptional ArsR family regulator